MNDEWFEEDGGGGEQWRGMARLQEIADLSIPDGDQQGRYRQTAQTICGEYRITIRL